jgi:hypothetical protein
MGAGHSLVALKAFFFPYLSYFHTNKIRGREEESLELLRGT